jgi:hypothetical protein
LKTRLLRFIRHGIKPAEVGKERKISTFLFFVLIAIFFWLMIALTKNYTSSINYPVVYVNLPEDKVVVNELPQHLRLEVLSTGFKLIEYHLRFRKDPVIIDYQGDFAKRSSEDGTEMLINTSSLVNMIDPQIGSDLDVIDIRPRVIHLYFSERISKLIPVRPDFEFTIARQHQLSDTITIQPDSVIISGPATLINNYAFVETEKLVLNDLQEDYSQLVPLKTIETTDITLEPNQVRVFINIEKFTEGQQEIPLETINLNPEYTIRLIPDKIKIKYLVVLSRYEGITPEMFRAVVDLKNIEIEPRSNLKVEITKSPVFVQVVDVQPSRVDYILRR